MQRSMFQTEHGEWSGGEDRREERGRELIGFRRGMKGSGKGGGRGGEREGRNDPQYLLAPLLP